MSSSELYTRTFETVTFANGITAVVGLGYDDHRQEFAYTIEVQDWQEKIPVTDEDMPLISVPTVVMPVGQDGPVYKGYFVTKDGHLDLCKLKMLDNGNNKLVLYNVDRKALSLAALESA